MQELHKIVEFSTEEDPLPKKKLVDRVLHDENSKRNVNEYSGHSLETLNNKCIIKSCVFNTLKILIVDFLKE